MPDAVTNPSVSNLSLLTLRRVHRKARRLSILSDLPLPVVITWWLEKLPESVSASEQVEMAMTELELKSFKRFTGKETTDA
jgi:hypothetical protein